MRPDREMLKGVTDALLLATIASQPAHGYALAERLKRQSEGVFSLGEGTLYPLLYKLEDRGWVKGEWEQPDGGRKRRVYRITPAGRRQLERKTSQWDALVNGMTLVLGRASHA